MLLFGSGSGGRLADNLMKPREASVKSPLPVREYPVPSYHRLPRLPSWRDLALTLIGPPSVTLSDAGIVVSQPGSKVLALLTYLVLEPGPHSREELAGLLWGESPEPEARASLRQALKHLRDALGDVARSDRTVVELTQPIECDVRDFRRFVLQEPQRALATDIPRFLTGFSIRHAPQFDEWVSATRRELLQQYENALSSLAREAMGQMALAGYRGAGGTLAQVRPTVGRGRPPGGGGPLPGRGSRRRPLPASRSTVRYWPARPDASPAARLLNLARRVESDATPQSTQPVTDEWYARAPLFESSLIGRKEEWAVAGQGVEGGKPGSRSHRAHRG